MAKSFPNSGILSRNSKRTTDKHPEYKGTAQVDGVEYWLSAWINENQHGKYFKISFTPKDAQAAIEHHNQDPEDVPFLSLIHI